MTSNFNRILFGLLAIGGAVLPLGAQSALAQTNGGYAAPTQDLPQNQDQTGDPFSRGGNIESMFDLIHQANFGEIRSPGQFQQEQRQNINSEAERFRQEQERRLQQQKPQGTTQPQGQVAPIQPSGQTQ